MRPLAVLDLPLAVLTEYPGNPRRGDVDAIAESLREHGQYRAIIVRATDAEHPEAGGVILAGNHTYKGAALLNWPTIRCEVIDCDDITAAKIVAVDNRAADLGGYDDRLLAELLGGMDDLIGTGYDDDDLAALLTGICGDTPPIADDPDDHEPTPPAEPFCKTGDLWLLGDHRLTVGDSTSTDVWAALLDGRQADLVWTDPPYGVAYVGKTKDALTIDNDALDPAALARFLGAVFTLALNNTRGGACWYVASPPGPLSIQFAAALDKLGVLRQGLVWVKDQFVLGRSDYHYRHEPIWYGWTPGAAHHATADRTQDSVHEVARPKRSIDHPTMKPVELISRHIANSSRPGELVVDPFAGSGSTLLAAHDTARVAAVVEMDPRYADVICRRWQELTGDEPVLESTGEPHDFTKAAPADDAEAVA